MCDSKHKETSAKRGLKRKLDHESDGEKEPRALEKMARLRMEEVMTRARLRKCPSCATAVLKVGGCNRVQCACGELFCYNCGKPVIRCRFSLCRFYRKPSAKDAARRFLQRLRRRYPTLPFKECSAFLSEDGEDDGSTTP